MHGRAIVGHHLSQLDQDAFDDLIPLQGGGQGQRRFLERLGLLPPALLGLKETGILQRHGHLVAEQLQNKGIFCIKGV